ncbi:putative lipid-binding protein (SYLF/DUF500 domain) [Campylobacter pinnipediorum subsp. caledonicus]|uniref:Putative lipid-binding protein (SYLF/DUF500 domain) n=2 Tax=Campylobacter TaxID=194 RepID=A0A1S6U6Z3_9BACT|nr:putative lipid-binding protein (SYLF/DUF500 domain) [Campylobacter pinnipediorum subsp. caledonicus]
MLNKFLFCKIISFFMIISTSCFASEEILLDCANSFIMTYRANKSAPFKNLLQNSKAILIFPSVKKIGFLFGGMSGKGIMVLDPVGKNKEILTTSIDGGSLGLQVGYSDSTLVLFVLNSSIISDIKDSKIVISADANFAFGDINGGYKDIKDFQFSKDIYAYATDSGFFAGASFGGAVISLTNEHFRKNGYGYLQLQNALKGFGE